MAAKRKRTESATILAVAETPLLVDGIMFRLGQQADYRIFSANRRNEMLATLRRERVDFLLIDMHMRIESNEKGPRNGISLIVECRDLFPSVTIIAMSAIAATVYRQRGEDAGASGFFDTHNTHDELIEIIERLRSERVDIEEEQQELPVDKLSQEELDVFRLMGQGLNSREIADSKERSIKTIQTYRARIKAKLDIPKTQDLLREARRWVNSGR